MTPSEITAHARRAADAGLHPIAGCPFNHKEQPEQHRAWMRAYSEWMHLREDDGK